MICKNCGRETGSDERICPYCDYRTFVSEENYDDCVDISSEGEKPRKKPFNKEAAKSPDEYFFSTESYGETEPFDAAKPTKNRSDMPRRKRGIPCMIVSVIAFFAAAANFFVPFMTWVSYSFNIAGYNLSRGSMNLIDLTKRFAEYDSIVPFMTGFETEWNVSDILPEEIVQGYNLGRLAELILAGAFALSLLMYFIYILMLLFHVRRSAGMGISAALVNALSCGLFLKAVDMVNTELEQYNLRSYEIMVIDVSRVPQTALWISGLAAVLCVALAIIDRPKRRI